MTRPHQLPTTIRAPWTPEQVEALNRFQKSGRFHPFTCPGKWAKCAEHRDLVATTDGWVCACGKYRQDWASDFMLGNVAARRA
jgi:hypothetical protein